MSQGKLRPALCLQEPRLFPARGLSASFAAYFLDGAHDLEHTEALGSHGLDAVREQAPACSAANTSAMMFLRRAEVMPC